MINPEQVLRLGLIGVGRWGKTLIRTLNEIPDIRLERTGSRGPPPAKLTSPHCRHFTDWRELLDPKAMDGVIIATPPATHAAMVAEAIHRHIPVFVEKPLTMNLREAEDLRSAARINNTLIMVDHTHLFSPAYRELKNQMRHLGAIRALHCIAGNMGPFRPDVPVLWDWGSHDMAMCMDLLGVPLHCQSAQYLERRVVNDVEGEVIELQLATNTSIPIKIRMGNLIQPKTRYLAVYLEDAMFVYDDQSAQKLKRYGATPIFSAPVGDGETITLKNERPLKNAIIEFCSARRQGVTHHDSIDLGVGVVVVLSECETTLSLIDM
jgi:predicted dehydrogenase